MRACFIVPAAGCGARFSTVLPKQYQSLDGARSVLECTLMRLLDCTWASHIVVVLAAQDHHWASVKMCQDPRICTVEGGATRAASVYNGLLRAYQLCGAAGWALVHDAVRPLVRRADLDKLFEHISIRGSPAALGMPNIDSLHRCDASEIVTHASFSILAQDNSTASQTLWRAFTPQAAPIKTLLHALKTKKNHLAISDEISALHAFGVRVQMIRGTADNLKITYPEDLALARLWYAQQEA